MSLKESGGSPGQPEGRSSKPTKLGLRKVSDTLRKITAIPKVEGYGLIIGSDLPLHSTVKETVLPKFEGKEIKGVPNLSQEHNNWCGYTSLADLLQFNGYNVTPVDIFKHIHVPTKAPTLSQLGTIAKDLTGGELRAHYWDEVTYEKLRKRNPQFTPNDLLEAYLERDTPCIVRFPRHYIIAVGYDPKNETYLINNPAGGIRQIRKKAYFIQSWAERESANAPSFNSSYLMLALTKRKPD